MEEVLLRFCHIGKQIFEELDNGSLTKCREVNESWRGFIDVEKIVPFRIIKSFTNVPDTYLKKNFAKVDLDSVTELVKNIQHVCSEVHNEQRNFTVRSGPGSRVGSLRVLFIEHEKDGKKLKDMSRLINEDLFLTPCCNPTPVPIKLDENLLANLSTGKLFLNYNYDGNVSESHPMNPSNGYGETALHFAAKNGCLDVCKLIAENIEEKNPKDCWGETPLQMAEKNDQSSIVEYFQTLLEHPRKSILSWNSAFNKTRTSRIFFLKGNGKMNPRIKKAREKRRKLE